MLLSKLKILNGTQSRFGSCIYHPTMLGLPDYQKRRMQLNDEIGEHKEKFLARLRQEAATEDSRVYLPDLVSLIGIAQTEEQIQLVIILFKRFRESLLSTHEKGHTFGIDVLRLLHSEDKVEEAYSLFMEKNFISPFFRSWGCVTIMADMLHKKEMYEEVVDLFHLSRESLWGSPQNIITAVLAALYKMNTEEALSQALYIMNEIEQRRLRISRRSVGYLVMLALNLGHPKRALELMSSPLCQDVMSMEHTQVANYRLLALIQLKQIDEAVKLLEKFQKDTSLEGELPLFSETINKLEELISETDTRQKVKFATLKRALYRAGLVYPQTANEYVSAPIFSRNLVTSFLKSEHARVLTYESEDAGSPKFETF